MYGNVFRGEGDGVLSGRVAGWRFFLGGGMVV